MGLESVLSVQESKQVFLMAKHNKVPCTECGSAQTNKQCSNKMCKKGYVLTSLVKKSMQMQGPCQGGKEGEGRDYG
eukprot:scaffold1261_cov50-Cyclotella_meneghiniana.AAC.3